MEKDLSSYDKNELKKLLEHSHSIPPSLLVSATYDGEAKVAVLKFYNPKTQKIHLWYDDTGHKPYCYSKLQKDQLKDLENRPDVIKPLLTEKKKDLLNDTIIELTKIIVTDPLAIGGTSSEKSIRNVIEAWEADIKYYENYLYDKGLIMGAFYEVKDSKIIPIKYEVPKAVEESLKKVLDQSDPDFKSHIIEWAKLLSQPLPDISRASLDIEVLPEAENRLPDPVKAEFPILAVSIVGSDGANEVFLLKRKDVELGKKVISDDVKIFFFESEKELISSVFKRMLDYPFLITFNGDDFDFNYLYHRAMKFNIPKEQIPISLGKDVAYIKHGIHIDLYKTFMNRSLQIYAFGGKYVEHTLNGVSEALIGESKIEFEGSLGSLPLYELARYCHNDASITYKLTSFNENLLMKLLVVIARVAKMPIDDVARLGVSNWIRSMMYFEHRRINALIPKKEELEEKGGAVSEPVTKGKKYKGALVVEPKAGVHFNVSVLDFASLYPSIIKVYNLSYETVRCVHPDCKDNMIPETEHWVCKKRRGISSLIIGSLRDLRVNYYKPLSKDPSLSPADKNLYNVVAQALKVILNASYGVMGAEIYPLYCLPVAEATAAIGRYVISNTIEKCKKLDINVIYGDSVTADRYVTLLNPQGLVEIVNIEKIFERFTPANIRFDGKEEVYPEGWMALSMNMKTGKAEFKPLISIVRHRTNKKIYSVNQKWGSTRVTEDHSLITNCEGRLILAKPMGLKDKELVRIEGIPEVKQIEFIDVYDAIKPIKYTTVYKGRLKTAQAYHDDEWVWFSWTNRKKLIKVKRFIKVGSEEFKSLCRILGAYIAKGSSSTPDTTPSKAGASISSGDKDWLESLKSDYYRLFNGAKTRIIPSSLKVRQLIYVKADGGSVELEYRDKTHKLQMMNKISAIFFKAFCGQKSKGKRLPQFIFHVPYEYKRLLLENMIKGDGSKKLGSRYSQDYKDKNFRYETNSLELVGGLSFLLSQLGIKYSIEYREKNGTYRISTASSYKRSTRPPLVREERYDGYVYDLTVEAHHTFVDSCGNIVLKNTDSLFLESPSKKQVVDISEWAEDELEIELDLDKTYRYVAFSQRKKNYLGVLPDGSVDIKGLTGKKSHIPAFIKKAFYETVNTLSKVESSKDFEKARESIKCQLREKYLQLKERKIPLEELAFNVMIGKPPSKYTETTPQHVKAAQLLINRGQEVKAGEIISFVKTTTPPGVKPLSLAKIEEIDVEKYLDYLRGTFEQLLDALGYSFDEILGSMKLEDFFWTS